MSIFAEVVLGSASIDAAPRSAACHRDIDNTRSTRRKGSHKSESLYKTESLPRPRADASVCSPVEPGLGPRPRPEVSGREPRPRLKAAASGRGLGLLRLLRRRVTGPFRPLWPGAPKARNGPLFLPPQHPCALLFVPAIAAATCHNAEPHIRVLSLQIYVYAYFLLLIGTPRRRRGIALRMVRWEKRVLILI